MSLEKLTGLVIEALRTPRRVEHALKVYAYARSIGGEAGVDGDAMTTLGAAALLHDIGIPAALAKHGSARGPYQEEEGARLAPEFLRRAGIPAALHDHVVRLVGSHHTESLAGTDALLQVLMEADYLVNLAEGNLPPERTPAAVLADFFQTTAGKRYLAALFDV